MSLTKISKPVVRRIGRLIVRVEARGLSLRGYRRRKWTTYSWSQITMLADGDTPILKAAEEQAGRRFLEAICNGTGKRRKR
jgi:hypothetical protein